MSDLLEQEANFDVIDSLGWSPLKHAEVFGHKEVQELLKEFMYPEEERYIGSEAEVIENYDEENFVENEVDDDDDELQVVHEDLVEDRWFSISRKNFLQFFDFNEKNIVFTIFRRDFEEDEDDEDEDFILETGEIQPNTWPRRNRRNSRMKKSIHPLPIDEEVMITSDDEDELDDDDEFSDEGLFTVFLELYYILFYFFTWNQLFVLL